MKTYKNIFDQVVAFENLMAAHEHARKGKRDRTEVLVFEQRKAEYCIILKNRLVKQTYRVGPYRIFWIRRPVLRMAMALHYPDRVVQWGIYQVVFPIFDKGFISDSYACRKGKGAHAALDQLQYWMRQADRGGPAYRPAHDVAVPRDSAQRPNKVWSAGGHGRRRSAARVPLGGRGRSHWQSDLTDVCKHLPRRLGSVCETYAARPLVYPVHG